MIEHAWTLACAKSIIDPSTNNMSITEVLEQLNVQGRVEFPTIAPLQSDVISVWYRSDPERGTRGSGRLTFLGPDKNPVGTPHEFSIDLTGNFRMRTITRLAGIPLQGPGIYTFKVEYRVDASGDWREVARIPLNVIIEQGAVVISASGHAS